jgi:cytochrome c biogenesis protein CcmG, thiol:disulfide interchange protein DsbE
VRRYAFSALAVLAVAGMIAVEVLGPSSNGTTGMRAPPLPTAALSGARVSVTELRGKPAFINFWASWCDPCHREAPEIERFDRSLRGRARLVGVDYTDQSDSARSFIHHYGWSFPVLSDPDGIAGARYGFTGLPSTVVLDRAGRIVETLRGPQDLADLDRALRAAVAN